MERIGIFFLHGFLGQPSDWQKVLENLSLPRNVELQFVDLFKNAELAPSAGVDLEGWATAFNRFVRAWNYDRHFLVGYSLGGRLALEALAQAEKSVTENSRPLWSQVICLSTHPGLADQARAARLENDEIWAEKFHRADWEPLVAEWNAQEVFAGGTAEPKRREQDFIRENLSQALRQWSLARQKNQRENIRAYADKIMWLVGAKDQKFSALAEDLQNEIPHLNLLKIPFSGHRILVDRPEAVAHLISHLFA